jgi:hypothetical protein
MRWGEGAVPQPARGSLLRAATRGPLRATAYGVPADGRRDAAPALQALLRAAPPGATVLLPAGDYLLRARLWLSRPLTLQGEPGSRLLAPGVPAAAALSSTAADGAQSSGGGPAASTAAAAPPPLPAFLGVAADGVTLQGLTLVGGGQAGVGIDATPVAVSQLTVRDCVLTDLAGAGIQVGHLGAPCRDVRILGNRVLRSRFPISLVFNCTGAEIVGNVVRASPQRGIMLNLLNASTGPCDVLIRGNRVEALGHTAALSIEAGNGVRVLENDWIAGNGIFGFYAYFTGESAAQTDVLIQGNTFVQGSPHTGFCGVFGAANGIRLQGNRFRAFHGGLGADPNCRHGNLVLDNVFTGLVAGWEGTWIRGAWTFRGNVGIATPPFVAP